MVFDHKAIQYWRSRERDKRCDEQKDIDGDRVTCVEDESMNQWLKVINAKLDYLISQFLAKREAIVMTIEPLNISINGMSIIVQDKLRFDDLLKI